MPDLPALLTDLFAPAFSAVAGAAVDPAVHRSEHADFQADGALALARGLRRSPRDIASEVLVSAGVDGLVATAEVTGPGFINITVDNRWLAARVQELAGDPRVGVARVALPQRVVVDYSGPNVAKEMHVGHLRSTIIGDAFCRVLEFLGHDVVRRNHIGDWGTPFGMLIEHLLDVGDGAGTAPDDVSISDLNAFYRAANANFETDPAFADRARARVVKLQGGDEATLARWRLLVAESARHFADVYARLRITLTDEHIAGESSYNDDLADVVGELESLGMVRESDGARCVFPPGFRNRDGDSMPLILVKRDGGYNYDTTDLAAIRHRGRDLHGERLVYLTDWGQRLHFELVFAVAAEAGWLSGQTAEFVGFGMVLGADGKRLRTRSGDAVHLVDLLDEARDRARRAVTEKNPAMPEAEREVIAAAVAVGAVKYADLATERSKDSVLDFDRMLSFDGNTAPYLQYAHARIRSIFRRADLMGAPAGARVLIADPAERSLALVLLGFEPVCRRSADDVTFHRLAGYLFAVATSFTDFYGRCPVLRADDDATRNSRLVLCEVTAQVLATGLGLLGIDAPERM